MLNGIVHRHGERCFKVVIGAVIRRGLVKLPCRRIAAHIIRRLAFALLRRLAHFKRQGFQLGDVVGFGRIVAQAEIGRELMAFCRCEGNRKTFQRFVGVSVDDLESLVQFYVQYALKFGRIFRVDNKPVFPPHHHQAAFFQLAVGLLHDAERLNLVLSRLAGRRRFTERVSFPS